MKVFLKIAILFFFPGFLSAQNHAFVPHHYIGIAALTGIPLIQPVFHPLLLDSSGSVVIYCLRKNHSNGIWNILSGNEKDKEVSLVLKNRSLTSKDLPGRMEFPLPYSHPEIQMDLSGARSVEEAASEILVGLIVKAICH